MPLPIPKLTGSTVTATPNNVIPSGASTVDETILAPKINQVIDELNALGARVAALTTPSPAPAVRISITAAQEAALAALPIGARIVFVGPTKELAGQVYP